MSYRVNPQFATDPKVAAEPLRECRGGPADGLLRSCPEGYVLLCARVTETEMNTVALPYDVARWSLTLGSYAGHYVPDSNVLVFRKDMEPLSKEQELGLEPI